MSPTSLLKPAAVLLVLAVAAVWFVGEQQRAEQEQAAQRFLDAPGFTRDWSGEAQAWEGVQDRRTPSDPLQARLQAGAR